MRNHCCVLTCIVAAAGLAASWAVAQPPADKSKQPAAKPTQPAAKPADKTPAGQPEMTPEQKADMKAYEEAAKPGKEHAVLQKAVGTWEYTMKMWETPGTTPMESKGKSECVSVLDGRFTQCKVEGDMGPMGMFHGTGIYGFDNVVKEYQCFWIDSMGTGMSNGTGKLSADGKTMTWTMSFNCPIQKKQITMREVETYKSDNEIYTEFYGTDRHSGKEFKQMEMTSKRVGAAPAKAATPAKPAGAK